MNNNDEFLKLYNRLDANLRTLYQIDNHQVSVVKKYEDQLKRSSASDNRERGYAIETIRNIRNTLVHESKFYNKDSFVIEAEVIEFLKQELKLIANPRRLSDKMRNYDDVYKVNLYDKVITIAETMKRYHYSHAPVVDEEKKLIGVFSESTLFTYLLNYGAISLKKDMIVEDFLPYILIDNHDSERFEFYAKDCLLSDIYDRFEKKQPHEKRLAMIFVTEHGKTNEPILGIITLTDLISSKQ